MQKQLGIGITVVGVIFSIFWTSVDAKASEHDVAAFYKGKQVAVIIGYPAGGGYDTYARLLARHIGRHIPGEPNMLPRNMPGAGSMIAANYLYILAPKDGTEFGIFAGGMALNPLLGNKKARFDPEKFLWIGSMNQETSLCVSWATSPIKTIQDAFKKQLIIGTASSTGTSFVFPTAANNLLGTKFKLVSGYRGSRGIMLALERGEVQGMCGLPLASIRSRKPEWLKEKKINILLQETIRGHADLPNVPTVMDFAKTKENKKIMELIYGWQIMGRPFTAPPAVPGNRIKALRAAFDATMKDPKLRAGAKKIRLEINPLSGQEIKKFITRIYQTPKALVKRTAEIQGLKKSK